MKKETWFYRVLKRIGLIKEYKINKKEMCERAKSVCSGDCECCIWHEDKEET